MSPQPLTVHTSAGIPMATSDDNTDAKPVDDQLEQNNIGTPRANQMLTSHGSETIPLGGLSPKASLTTPMSPAASMGYPDTQAWDQFAKCLRHVPSRNQLHPTPSQIESVGRLSWEEHTTLGDEYDVAWGFPVCDVARMSDLQDIDSTSQNAIYTSTGQNAVYNSQPAAGFTANNPYPTSPLPPTGRKLRQARSAQVLFMGASPNPHGHAFGTPSEHPTFSPVTRHLTAHTSRIPTYGSCHKLSDMAEEPLAAFSLLSGVAPLHVPTQQHSISAVNSMEGLSLESSAGGPCSTGMVVGKPETATEQGSQRHPQQQTRSSKTRLSTTWEQVA